jgi:hypothetical protein
VNDGFGLIIAFCVLFGIIWGMLKQSNNRKTSTEQNKRIIKQKKEPHPEYPEEPDYPDPEDADLIEFDL